MRMNPVYKNELKMSARSMQLPVLAVIFNSILSVVALIALYGIRQNYINSGGNPYHSMMILYVVVLTIEVVLLCLFVPSAAGGSIAGERDDTLVAQTGNAAESNSASPEGEAVTEGD